MTFAASIYDATKYQNSESIYAALALDSYGRGYGAKLHDVGDTNALLLGEEGQQLGNAEILFDSRVLGNAGAVRLDEAAGFYAIAYKVGNEVVIAYRGSDQLETTDHVSVTSIAGGQVDPQVLLALQFFNEVQDHIAGTTTLMNANLVLVGHSLGGALTGLVSSLKKTVGIMFDNTAFELAASNMIDRATSAPDPNGNPQDEAFRLALEQLIFRGEDPWDIAHASSLKTVSLEHDVAESLRGFQTTQEDTPYLLGNFPLNPNN